MTSMKSIIFDGYHSKACLEDKTVNASVDKRPDGKGRKGRIAWIPLVPSTTEGHQASPADN